MIFFFNDTATTEIYTLSLHDALPIFRPALPGSAHRAGGGVSAPGSSAATYLCLDGVDEPARPAQATVGLRPRSEEHTSELQSRQYLVCRLLLEKKKKLRHLLHSI